ncbi:hypothetical protein M3Y96_01208900 [Aphelenchoides besseyi]|nr:hypothetical protein M3Y96_01208900 [Aphelenchoides besseyi]
MFGSWGLVFLLSNVANVFGERGKYEFVNGNKHFSLIYKELNETFIIPGKRFLMIIRNYGPIYIEDHDFYMSFGGCSVPAVYYNTSNNPRLLINGNYYKFPMQLEIFHSGIRTPGDWKTVIGCKILFEWIKNTMFHEIVVSIRSDHGLMLLFEFRGTVNSIVEKPTTTTIPPPAYIVSVDKEEIPAVITLCFLAIIFTILFFVLLTYTTTTWARDYDIKLKKQEKRKELIAQLNEIPEPSPKKKKKKKAPEPIQQVQPVQKPLASTASISFHQKAGAFEAPRVEELKTAIETPNEMKTAIELQKPEDLKTAIELQKPEDLKTAIELQKPEECHTAVALIETPNAPVNSSYVL